MRVPKLNSNLFSFNSTSVALSDTTNCTSKLKVPTPPYLGAHNIFATILSVTVALIMLMWLGSTEARLNQHQQQQHKERINYRSSLLAYLRGPIGGKSTISTAEPDPLVVVGSNFTSYFVEHPNSTSGTKIASSATASNPSDSMDFDDDDDDDPSDDADHNKSSEFDDFDDYQALGLDKFYLPNKDRDEDATSDSFYNLDNDDERDRDHDGDNENAHEQPMIFNTSPPPAPALDLVDRDQYRRQIETTADHHQHGVSSKAKRPEAVASEEPQQSVSGRDIGVASRLTSGTCALPLASGTCVTFESVELAIKRALSEQRARLANLPDELGAEEDAEDENNDDDDDETSAYWPREPSESSINAAGELNELTARILANQYQLAPDEIALGLEQIDVRQTSLWRFCPRLYRHPLARPCTAGWAFLVNNATGGGASGGGGGDAISQMQLLQAARYRSHSGACNNLLEPRLGASYMPFARLMPAQYGDSVGSGRRSASGSQLPPPRMLALHLHPDATFASSDLSSALFSSWGQLINHDLAMASNARDSTGHQNSCCKQAGGGHEGSASASESDSASATTSRHDEICMPIEIAADDPVYGRHGVRCLDFKRSLAGLRPGCSLGPRTQLNLVSSFVDASFVYGSSRATSRSLRNPNSGKLKTWDYFANDLNLKPLLPAQLEQPDEECVGRLSRGDAGAGQYCFRSGDPRTNQQLALVVLHTIHVRLHNRLVDGLGQLNPHWPPGRLFEEARRIHIALLQHILLGEYLPQLLGPSQCDLYNLTESPLGHSWDHYEPGLNPAVSQEFAAAAFRQGHSSVPAYLVRAHLATRQPRRLHALRATYRQPWALFEPFALDELLIGQTETPAQANDPFVSRELSGHLLQTPGQPIGHDLVAINIQRGRDQGVASYNSVRAWCGLGRLAHMDELASVMSNQSGQLMGQLYESVDDIDLFSGGLSEFPLPGAQVGPTFACVIGRQFQALRLGDRLWFESSAGPHAFTGRQLDSIKQVRLARLVCANSDRVELIQSYAMRLPHPILNPLQHCATLPDVDLSLWQEGAAAGA